jgi:hypothetical protein
MTPNPYEPSNLPAEYASSARSPIEPNIVARYTAGFQFTIGMFAGFAIWFVTAPHEAWDANPFYSLHVGFAGAISSLFRFRGCW